MATAAADIEFIPDEAIEFIPDEPIEFIPDEPVDVPREAARATMGALQAVDVMNATAQLDWSEAAADEINALRQRSGELFAARQSNEAQRLSSEAMRLDEKLQSEAPQSTGAQRLRQQYSGPPTNVEGFQRANFLGRGLGALANAAGLAPLATDIERAGASPLGLNFQANIGAAAGGAAGAGMMMLPGGQPQGARTLAQMAAPVVAPMFGGFGGGMIGGFAQEKIEQAAETGVETLARHEALAETRREFPVASMIGGSGANIFTMRPSITQFTQALSGNRAAIASLGTAASIGGSMGVLPSLTRGEPVSLSQIAQSALENTIFNKPTRLGRALGLPAADMGGGEPPAAPEVPGAPVTPEAPKGPQILSTAIKNPDGTLATGPAINTPHKELIRTHLQSGGDPTTDVLLDNMGFKVRDPDGTERFATRDEAYEIAEQSGQLAEPAKNKRLSSEILKEPDAAPQPEQVTPVAEPAAVEAPQPTGQEEAAAPATPDVAVVEEAGRAVPAAPVGDPTGIRNAIVDPARAEAGIPARELPLARSFPAIHEEARAALANDPQAGRRLVSELGQQVRPLTDTEDAVLTFEQNAREQERTAAVDAVNNAPDEDAREAAAARLAQADNDLFEIYQVGQQAGTANARGLNARRLMQNQDFTLSKMLNEKRAIANNGEPLTKEQTAETTALHDRIKELETKLAGVEGQEATKTAQNEYRRIFRETKRDAGQAAKAKRSITDFMDDAAQKARDRIIARRGRLQVTVDPLNIAGLVDEAIIGASYVTKGVRNIADWSKQMINEFGERIRPHLDALFAKATALADDTGKSFGAAGPESPDQVLSKIADGAKLEQKVVYDLARAHVNAGMQDFNEVMAKVTEDLRTKFPSVTERQVMDALSGYGKTTTPSKEVDLVKLREFRNLARLTSQLEDAQKGVAPKKTGPQRDKATAKVLELQKKVNDAMRAAGIERTGPEQIASGLQASKTRIRNQIEELQDRIAKGDYEPRVKREPALDREKIDLQFQLAKEKEKWNQGLIEAKRAKRPIGQKIFEGIGEGMNLGRQLLTSADFPPVFRQGLTAIGRPITSAKAVVDSFKAMVSDKQRFRVMKEIDERPNAPLYSRSKLYLARDTAQPLSQMEENFMGNWFKQLPRWTIVGPILRASERSYNTFLNKLRADTFDAAVKAFNISETDTATLNSLAANINTFTGRSTLPLKKLEQAAPGLNTFLFAPRFMMSRFKVATGQPLWTGTGKSKLAAIDTYARTLGGLAVIYGLANMAGGQVELDPRSSDFGKIRFGQTRLDPLGGLSQVTTFMTRLITGETKTGKGKLVPLREENRPLKGTGLEAKGKPNMIVGGTGKVLANFLRSKLNPIVGTGVNLSTGENIVGEKVTAKDALLDMSVPISWQEILTTMEAQGVPRGPALFVLSLFGMGLNTYEERKK